MDNSAVLSSKTIADARDIVKIWLPRYPSARPWVRDAARAALRTSEDAWLASFRGLKSLSLQQVEELIDWKWQGYAAKRSKSLKGVQVDWDHARGCIERAIGEDDDGAAVDALMGRSGGIPDWHPAMSSVVLAACRPDTYAVVDSYALKTMMLLEGAPQDSIAKVAQFTRGYWESYLKTLREVSVALKVSLRDLDRAFVMSGGRRTP